jgi:heat shock protein HtpX
MNITATRFATQIRTWLLIAALTALLIAIGVAIGGGALYIFVALAVLMNVAGYWFSDKLALAASHARPLEPGEIPELEEIARDLAGRAGVPVPRLYLIGSAQPNAFATGRDPAHAAVAVTDGLLRQLPEDEVRGVLAHEFAHIKIRDILVSSIAAMVAGAVSAIATVLQFSLPRRQRRRRLAPRPIGRSWRSSSRRSRRSSSWASRASGYLAAAGAQLLGALRPWPTH